MEGEQREGEQREGEQREFRGGWAGASQQAAGRNRTVEYLTTELFLGLQVDPKKKETHSP